MTIGNRVKTIRKSLKLSQEQFAKQIQINQRTLSSIERDVTSLTDRNLQQICRVFGIEEHWLRTGEGEMRCEATVDEKLRAWVDEVLSGRPDSIRYAFLAVMSNLDDDGWRRIADFVEQVYCETHSTTPEEVDREKDRLQLADEIEESENQMEELYPSDGRNIV